TRNSNKTICLIGAAVMAAAGTASGDVLHDALRTITGFPPTYSLTFAPYSLIENGIGGANVFGFSTDTQAADDFSLSQAHSIDRVTIDMFSIHDGNLLPQNVMVEFFSDIGGSPAGAAHHSVVVGSSDLTHEGFSNW